MPGVVFWGVVRVVFWGVPPQIPPKYLTALGKRGGQPPPLPPGCIGVSLGSGSGSGSGFSGSLAGAPQWPAMAVTPTYGLTVDVDPCTGRATVWEVDASVGSVAIRRARTSGYAPKGPFGRGWRAEFEARVYALRGGQGFCVTRLQGRTAFVPTRTPGLYVTSAGEVETLRETTSGYELASALRRVLSFDTSGRLTQIAPDTASSVVSARFAWWVTRTV